MSKQSTNDWEQRSRKRAKNVQRKYNKSQTKTEDIRSAILAHLVGMEKPRRERAEDETDPVLRDELIYLASRPEESGMRLPVRGDTQQGIILSLQERYPGTPEHPIMEVLDCLEQDKAIYLDERESTRCFDAVWRIVLVEQTDSGEAGVITAAGPPARKPRMKREVAHPLIAAHLMKKPHDTAKEVSATVDCSIGVVSESPAWKLNQKRLRIAKRDGIDPKAVKLAEDIITEAGGGKTRQSHNADEQYDEMADEIDERDKELFARIAEYMKSHPGETPQKIAAAVGCTAGDVERRQAELETLVAEQDRSALEDTDVEDATAKGGKRREWVNKEV